MERSLKSPKSPMVCERHQSACTCMWGLYSMFDFRQGHSNKRLLPDGRRRDRRTVGRKNAGCTHTELDDLHKTSENTNDKIIKKNITRDCGKAGRKKFMGEEFQTEQQIKKITASELENVYLKHWNHREPGKKDSVSSHALVQGSKHAPTTTRQQPQSSPSMYADNSSHKPNLPACNQLHAKDREGHIYKRSRSIVNERRKEINVHVQMNDAVEAFVNQKLIDERNFGKDVGGKQSKHFLDALKILNSNKDLFIKLLQDPNSLLVKHIQDLKESQAVKGNAKPVSNDEFVKNTNSASQCKVSTFSQKMKSSDGCSAKETDDSQLLDRIVVLKPDIPNVPGPANETGDMRYNKHAYFSFGHLKRKLSKAMKVSKKKQETMSFERRLGNSPCDQLGLEICNGFGQKTAAENSPHEIISDIGLTRSSPTVKKKYETARSKDSKFRLEADLTCENNSHQSQSGSNPCADSRKQFPMILAEDTKDSIFSRKHNIETTMRMLNLAEHDLLPKISPWRDWKHHYFTAQTRFSACKYCQMANETSWRPQKEKPTRCLTEKKQNVETLSLADNIKLAKRLELFCTKRKELENSLSKTKVDPSTCSNKDDADSEDSMGILEANGCLNCTEGKNCINLPSETYTRRIDNIGSTNSNDMTNMFKEEVCWHGTPIVSKEEGLLVKDQPPTSSLELSLQSPISSKKFEDLDTRKDIAEQSSPVSILEQAFAKNDRALAPSTAQPDESYAQPLQVNSNEHGSGAVVGGSYKEGALKSSTAAEHGSTYEVVKAILEVYCMSSDTISKAAIMSNELLDLSLYDKVRVWPGQSEIDDRQLVDLSKEALLHMDQCRVKSCPWLSFITPTTHPTMLEKTVVHEVTKWVEGHLQQPPETLEQLVLKDLQKDAAWMDIRGDAEGVIIEIVGGILEELLMEMVVKMQLALKVGQEQRKCSQFLQKMC